MTKKTKQALYLPALLLLVIGAVWVIRQNQNMPYREAHGMIFGTSYNVKYQWDEDLKKGMEAEMQKVDQSLSTFNKTSVISLVNQNKPVKLDEMFVSVFDLAKQVSKDTDGAFDITVAPLVNAWGFGFKNDCMPTDKAVDSLRQLVGYDKVTMIAGKTVRKSDPRVMLDCSAIAKGYAVDVVASFLKRQGIKNFVVEIGGEVVTSGVNPQQRDWHIGINKPSDDSLSTSNEIEAVVLVKDQAMATSGNYRNFYYKDGQKYAHTIDPRTGRPVQHNILSATVIAPNCAMADAYATSFMVMGFEGAKNVLSRNKNLKAYLIYTDRNGKYQTWHSDNFPEIQGN